MVEDFKNVYFGYFEEEYAENKIVSPEKKQEYFEKRYMSSGVVVFADKYLMRIPYEFVFFSPKSVAHLTLDGNDLRDMSFLKYLPNLSTLSLNKNKLMKYETLPPLKKLIMLSLDTCEFDDLYEWIQCIQKGYPELSSLSVCGSYFLNNKITIEQASNRRRTIISMLPNLSLLDKKLITARERKIAQKYAPDGIEDDPASDAE